MSALESWASRCILVLLLSALTGCVAGRIQPRHFQFVTVVNQAEPGPGGWRAACVHAKMKNGTTGEFFYCKFGVETPLENLDGPISTPLAQRIAADCANEAATMVLGSATAESPIGLLCESFKTTYELIFSQVIKGAHVQKVCHPLAKPVVFGL